ncbi:MAG: polyprenyl synthetase family protein [Planctomycetota bacterium]
MIPERKETASGTSSVAQLLQTFASRFDQYLGTLITVENNEVDRVLREAMAYALLSPGKRLRPFLVVRCCELVGGREDDALASAAAVECVHAFSLVHDDLPAMDNDDVRRGRPTCHKKFGEAMAILAGDALVVLAFQVLAERYENSRVVSGVVKELAEATGWSGMIGGQAADILGEKSAADVKLTATIHQKKTARLFRAACRIGGMAGNGSTEQVESLGRYGETLGRAFQIADDLLDVTGNSLKIGKETGKDASAGKQTYPRSVGIEESRRIALGLADEAIQTISGFGVEADALRDLAGYAVARDY